MDNLANVKPFDDNCFFAPPTIAESSPGPKKLQATVRLSDNEVDLIDDHDGLYLFTLFAHILFRSTPER
jgi:hypothetical protein